MRGIIILSVVILWTGLMSLSAFPQSENEPDSEYAFDLSEIEEEIEKKPYSIGGFLEFEPVLLGLDRDAAFYKLKFFDKSEGQTTERYDMRLRLEGSYQKGIAGLYFRADGLLGYDYLGWDDEIDLLEGYFSLKPTPSVTIDTGKKVTKWGKGYAWNPVSFVDRPKNPEDPEEALEGFDVLTADFIKSFDGPLQTLAFTPVVIPVTEEVNDEFGKTDHINFGAKLYALYRDTDLDFIFFKGASRTTSYGFDFARNLKPNLEIHGELAWITDFEEKSLDSQGNLSTSESDVLSALLGFRYLTANETTFIVEYYHNGRGISKDDFENFVEFVDQAYDTFLATGDSSGLNQANELSEGNFGGANPMRDYIYIRASQKEPFDILYLTPAITSICNLHDQSFVFIPELMYSLKTNLEIRLRGAFLVGGGNTEYGEKQNDFRLELRARFFF